MVTITLHFRIAIESIDGEQLRSLFNDLHLSSNDVNPAMERANKSGYILDIETYEVPSINSKKLRTLLWKYKFLSDIGTSAQANNDTPTIPVYYLNPELYGTIKLPKDSYIIDAAEYEKLNRIASKILLVKDLVNTIPMSTINKIKDIIENINIILEDSEC
jgi:hypothetical protein